MSRGDSEFFEDAAPSAPTPAHPRPVRPGRPTARVGILAVILVVAVLVGIVDRVAHRPALAAAPPVPVNSVPPASVESSVWYCAGGNPASATNAAESLQLVNTTDRTAHASISAVTDTGERRQVPVAIPADGQLTESPGSLLKGNFVAATVDVAGGGVLVTQSVAGGFGWSVAPCSRSTASAWYFASGSTINGATLAVALYNPTTTEAVVDMTFVTPSGIAQPQPFEGIVLAPNSLAVEQVDRYVQDAHSVSTVVSARTGAVVATALQVVSSNGSRGLSLRLGSPQLAKLWSVPHSIDLSGGLTAITIFNPTQVSEQVTVTVRPYRSPAAPFSEVLGPSTAWVLETSSETRIPNGIPFSATVRVRSGPGVVVDRSILATSSFGTPQFGATTALDLGAEPAADTGVLAAPGTAAQPVTPGAAVAGLDLVNPSSSAVVATVWALEGTSGAVRIGSLAVGPNQTLTVGTSASLGVQVLPGIASLGRVPLLVSAGGPLLVLEDLSPSATAGVVSVPGSRANGF